MINNNTVLIEINGSIATIWLNRPEKQNAMDFEMISGFLSAIQTLNSTPGIRIIIIRGKGKSFCSGADLRWMQHASMLTNNENYAECEALATCYFEVFNSSKITVCAIQGASIGGANGFVAASDFSVAGITSRFAFSEIRIGLLPATIAPYIIRKTGKGRALELMLTGKTIGPDEAKTYDLINHVVADDDLDNYLSDLTGEMLKGAPLAQRNLKAYLRDLDLQPIDETLVKQTATMLAELRTEAEAREGMNAFLKKGKPAWTRTNL
jgi:methylglutaconyl-CoA hydratase